MTFAWSTVGTVHVNGVRLGCRQSGDPAGAPVLLLHTIGARSGEERVHPLMYLADDGRYLLFASAAGTSSPRAFMASRPSRMRLVLSEGHMA